jgi:hypothetical protein
MCRIVLEYVPLRHLESLSSDRGYGFHRHVYIAIGAVVIACRAVTANVQSNWSIELVEKKLHFMTQFDMRNSNSDHCEFRKGDQWFTPTAMRH